MRNIRETVSVINIMGQREGDSFIRKVNNMKKITSGKSKSVVIAMIVAMVVLFGSVTSCFAANVCSNVSGNSKFNAKTTFVAKTTSKTSLTKDYIKLGQNKGVMKYTSWLNKSKSFSCYGRYWVTVTDTKSKRVVYDKAWKDSSVKIKLPAKNRTYKVVVKSASFADYQVAYVLKGAMDSWIKYAKFTATKTKGITFCK